MRSSWNSNGRADRPTGTDICWLSGTDSSGTLFSKAAIPGRAMASVSAGNPRHRSESTFGDEGPFLFVDLVACVAAATTAGSRDGGAGARRFVAGRVRADDPGNNEAESDRRCQ